MIKAKDFCGYLKKRRFTFFSGVPCSILKEVLDEVMNDEEVTYVPAVRENAALGVASGAYLAGRQSVVLMQNSGLGNIINALTSFNLIYRIPVLLLITWRGFQGKDAPEHIIMGKKMLTLLRGLEIPYRIMGPDYKNDIDWAISVMMDKSLPAVLILKEGVIR